MTPAIVFVLLVLVTVVVAMRAYLAWQRLMALATTLSASADALDRRDGDVRRALADARRDLRSMNAAAELALWRLPGLDARLDAATVGLGSWHARADEVRTLHLAAADDLIAKGRALVRAVRIAMEVRRSIGV